MHNSVPVITSNYRADIRAENEANNIREMFRKKYT